jgi:hypothetical protein
MEGDEWCVQGLVRERDNLEGLGVEGAIILKLIVKK